MTDEHVSADSGTPLEISIRDDVIRLGQLLKLAGVVDSGTDARELLDDGAVRVDGEPESRRGRQLGRGALVEIDLPTGRRTLTIV